MCLFAPVPYYKLNEGFFLGSLFTLRGGCSAPRCLNKKASEKNPLFITNSTRHNIISISNLLSFISFPQPFNQKLLYISKLSL